MKKISDQYRTLLIVEIETVVKKMQENSKFEEKLYFFTAIAGMMQRVYNIEYNDDLIFAHSILHYTQTAIQQRISAIKSGDSAVHLTNEQFDELEEASSDLAEDLRLRRDWMPTLKKFCLIAYSTTGNGYYLKTKGMLKIK